AGSVGLLCPGEDSKAAQRRAVSLAIACTNHKLRLQTRASDDRLLSALLTLNYNRLTQKVNRLVIRAGRNEHDVAVIRSVDRALDCCVLSRHMAHDRFLRRAWLPSDYAIDRLAAGGS